MNPNVTTLAKWLARKTVKAQWRAMGRRPAEASKLYEAANAYFALYREELLEEARNHPALIRR